ncbi:benenodin family lasso peptide [Novosphingobium sp. BW1]|nr:benenodin family lasso peptide [Novosphingobium sp. BW1]
MCLERRGFWDVADGASLSPRYPSQIGNLCDRVYVRRGIASFRPQSCGRQKEVPMERETQHIEDGVIELGAVSERTEGNGEAGLDIAGQRNQVGISDD